MDQKKIGLFLKELRNEKGLTQEQLSEVFHVSSRTISRWETGSNLPDISLLVGIADFYEVDVRELMEGERKSEMMSEELKDVASKMADYADNEKSKVLSFIQVASFIGVLVLTLAIVLQCMYYEPDPRAAGAIILSTIGFIVMVIITLHVTGLLAKLMKHKRLMNVIKIVTIGAIVVALKYLVSFGMLYGVMALDFAKGFNEVTGIENYDRQALIEEEHGDMGCYFKLFPDKVDSSFETEYTKKTKVGLFDTDGYIFLKVAYDEATYHSEVERISSVSVTNEENGVYTTHEVYLDEDSYNYPAYIAMDGYADAYEYALMDESNYTIYYVVINYPYSSPIGDIKEYTKKDYKDYRIKNEKALEYFSIYAFPIEELGGYTETEGI